MSSSMTHGCRVFLFVLDSYLAQMTHKLTEPSFMRTLYCNVSHDICAVQSLTYRVVRGTQPWIATTTQALLVARLSALVNMHDKPFDRIGSKRQHWFVGARNMSFSDSRICCLPMSFVIGRFKIS